MEKQSLYNQQVGPHKERALQVMKDTMLVPSMEEHEAKGFMGIMQLILLPLEELHDAPSVAVVVASDASWSPADHGVDGAMSFNYC